MRLKLLFFLPLLIFAVKMSSQDNFSLLEGKYKITKLNEEDISEYNLTLIIDDELNKVSGNAGCNSYRGSFSISQDDRISFQSIFRTKKHCADPKKNQIEEDFLLLLENRLEIITKKDIIELVDIYDSSKKISLIQE